MALFSKVKTSLNNYFFLACLGFSVLAVLSSILGVSTFKVNLTSISENLLIANFIYTTFIIMLCERIVETYNSTFRKPKRVLIEEQLAQQQLKISTLVNGAGSTTSINKEQEVLNAIERKIINFKHDTRKRALLVSFIIGGTLTCVGCLNIIAPFIDHTLQVSSGDYLSSNILVDLIAVLLSAMVVAGGSDGWNSVTRGLEAAVNPNKP